MTLSTTRKATFTVTLNEASDQTVSVDYAATALAADTGVAGTDFEAVTGTLTFAPGDLSKTIDVFLGETTTEGKTFHVKLSNPVNCSIQTGGGVGTIGTPTVAVASYLDRFDFMYAALKNADNGYFGPPSGARARTVPYHCPEKLICEAPDHGHESVSETISFWVGLEAWQGALHSDWVGYQACWNSITTTFIPNASNQPDGTYTPAAPATYAPEQNNPSQYPVLGVVGAPVGPDPLYTELKTTYSVGSMFLMHWLVDVDGVYGFHNGDGTTTCVLIHNFQRGLQESTWETLDFPCWEDFSYGGGSSGYGFLPVFQQNKPLYPAAPYDYGKQWRYTCAPDAEGRVLQWAFRAASTAFSGASKPAPVTTGSNYAKKMGDYLRYCLFDKYFRKIGDNQNAATAGAPYGSCHYLISWYASWGGEVPASGQTPSWAFRIGSSDAHQGYQAPNIAYYMATGGGGFIPQSPSAGDIWLGSLYRQLEMIRWLQTEQGPIAGGVSNSMEGRYVVPTDGRQTNTFYGMVYTYAPVWHDPPSNNWFGFNVWGLGRVAELFHQVTIDTNSLATAIRPNCEVILDRFVQWVLEHVTLDADGGFTLPDTLNWTSPSAIAGQTTTAANLEGVYEYLPSLNWPGASPDYSSFWNASAVPNPNLKFTVVATGQDLGVGSSLASLLIFYAQAKRNLSKFTTAIPNSPTGKTPEDAYVLAKGLIDRIWTLYKDDIGIAKPEARGDYLRYGDPVYIPSNWTGTMPNGDPINQSSTYISIRSFQKSDPLWTTIQNYIANPATAPVPTPTYHRFWAQVEYAMACAAMHKYFSDIADH
ncbi:hypothetical protein GJ654_10445 [Rhodoblastus acidophilus]|uniref:Calx-beta domain-containing protein n=1 Tax=Rhodoblastus acidophilus TaxID=1074 RepID=A0A6N8DQE3_RHOAC|nr:glycoside hydrolase family 48 protein [Rhodoblastus acidophilus]MCW2275145.1 hypothetical protein [Rhodoblastus acidophilus]MTV31413.1 hypothetical protein [Rhodoblastus acidophilus]